MPNHNSSCFASNHLWRCERQTVLMLLCECTGSSRWNDNTSLGFKIHRQAPPPVCLPSVYQTSPHVTKSPGLLIRICILQVIKDWRWEWPRNETINVSHHNDVTQGAQHGSYLHGRCSSVLSADEVSIVAPHLLVGSESVTTQLLLKW